MRASLPRTPSITALTSLLALGLAACASSTAPDDRAPAALEIVGGDGQSQVANLTVPEMISVRVVDARGRPVPEAKVEFQAVAGGGWALQQEGETSSNGIATTTWRVGTIVGEAQRLEARLVSGSGRVIATQTLTAHVLAGAPVSFELPASPPLTAPAGAVLPEVIVRLRDRYQNLVPGAMVTWAVVSGGGSVSPLTTLSDAAGTVRVVWTMGPQSGTEQAMRANVPGMGSIDFSVMTQ